MIKMMPKIIPLCPVEQTLGLFWRPTPDFVEQLACKLKGKRVLEVFAGNGYLAASLKKFGVEVTATSILSGMDAHDYGLYHPVQELNAVQAIHAYGQSHDVLLMCWPTVTDQVFAAAVLWGDKPIAFIGEMTDYAKGQLGGCATDDFFEHFHVTQHLDAYQGRYCERACIGKMGPSRLEFVEQRRAWKKTTGNSIDPVVDRCDVDLLVDAMGARNVLRQVLLATQTQDLLSSKKTSKRRSSNGNS